MAVKADVHGLAETQRKLEQVVADLRGEPFLQAMRDATLIVQGAAKQAAPVDTGRLRASITPEIRTEGNRVLGVVGSNVKYAPYMELGTGTFAGKNPYFPPPKALNTWARRHGVAGGGFVVAMAIYKAGGLRPRRFLQQAFEQNEGRIREKIERAVKGIVDK